MPLVSVIIPVYNPGEALIKTLDSVINQTYKALEIILVDDGSTDGSDAVCDEYALKDERIKVLHQQNSGVSVARNKGIEIACGEYIAFFDSDDIIDEKMIEEMADKAFEYNADLVTSDIVINGELIKCNLPDNALIEEKVIFEEVLPCFTKSGTIAIFAPTTKLYKAELLNSNNIRFNENICFQEDLMFTVTVYANSSSMLYIPKGYYQYIQQQGGLCSSYRKNAGHQFIYAREEFEKLIEEYQMVNLDYNHFNCTFLYNISYYIYRTNHNVSDKSEKSALINQILESDLVKRICSDYSENAVSFDKRIATAIAGGKIKKSLWLIELVYSGNANKLQSLYSKIRK